MDTQQIDVMVADASHEVYVDTILETIRNAAKVRGTGIAERTHEYVATKMKEGKAIIALCGDVFAGFTYIESWGNKQYVATSGLIVHPDFRGLGLAKRIKQASFQLARLRWPRAKIFSLTSGAAVMKMNTELGYVPVTFNELTDDEAQDLVHQESSGQAWGITKSINQFSLSVTLHINNAVASVHTHITGFNRSINICTYTTAANDIITFLQR